MNTQAGAQIGAVSTLEYLIATIQEIRTANADPAAPREPVELTANTSIQDAGVDSFDFIEVIFKVEDHFKIEIDHNANNGFDPTITLGFLAGEIDRRIGPAKS